jgi:flagellar capping protein FliD
METTLLSELEISHRICWLRGQKVLLDFDIASLYGIETKQLKRQVKRNLSRFPADFMFEFTPEEWENLRCQSGTSSWGGIRYPPFAFTEQGVAMLSSVISSEQAIEVNIAIMRVFVQMRRMLGQHADLQQKLDKLEQRYDEQFAVVFEAIRQLMQPEMQERKPIGYRV